MGPKKLKQTSPILTMLIKSAAQERFGDRLQNGKDIDNWVYLCMTCKMKNV